MGAHKISRKEFLQYAGMLLLAYVATRVGVEQSTNQYGNGTYGGTHE